MLMRTLIVRAVALAAVLSPALVFPQGGRTKPTTATYSTKEEVDIVNSQGQGIDRNIRTVDIGHENFSVGIIHRGKRRCSPFLGPKNSMLKVDRCLLKMG